MSPAEIADSVAMEVLNGLHDALATDLIAADKVIAEPMPTAFVELHAAGGDALALRLALWILDGIDERRLTSEADCFEHLRIACTRLMAVLDFEERRYRIIRPEWVDEGSKAVAVAFRMAVNELLISPKGGRA